jgi:carbon-monoxide dehydrogenase medium subunit
VLGTFTVSRPTELGQALDLIGEESLAYWGGTELFLAMKMQLLMPGNLVDLKGIPQLREIRMSGDELVIGAGTTHDEIATDPGVRGAAGLLSSVTSRVGNSRVRAQGTIGGNLCFAEPRSDLATVLLALDAMVQLQSLSGERRLSITEFLLGPYWTAREPEELLVAVCVPIPAATGVYLKFQFTERPSVAVTAVVSDGGQPCRLAIGAVADLPALHTAESWDEFDAASIAAGIEPVPDLTGSVTYKRHLTEVLVKKAIAAVRAGERDG